ncbi:hypothetical protein GCM10020331_094680 [Ectobacillus funiculus]
MKCEPGFLDYWRQIYTSVVPAFHLNKDHWNSIILDGTVPEEEIYEMIRQSYMLTKKVTVKLISISEGIDSAVRINAFFSVERTIINAVVRQRAKSQRNKEKL